MATALAAAALIERVDPNWRIASTASHNARASADSPGPSWPGLSEPARELSQAVLAIRQFGSTRSINAAAASAVAMHEWIRRWAPDR